MTNQTSADDAAGDSVVDERRRGWFWCYNFVLDQYGLDLGPFAGWVYMFLLRYADGNNTSCFPGQDRLAEETGISKRQVVRSIEKLENLGLIRSERRTSRSGRATNIYFLLIPPRKDRPRKASDLPQVLQTDLPQVLAGAVSDSGALGVSDSESPDQDLERNKKEGAVRSRANPHEREHGARAPSPAISTNPVSAPADDGATYYDGYDTPREHDTPLPADWQTTERMFAEWRIELESYGDPVMTRKLWSLRTLYDEYFVEYYQQKKDKDTGELITAHSWYGMWKMWMKKKIENYIRENKTPADRRQEQAPARRTPRNSVAYVAPTEVEGAAAKMYANGNGTPYEEHAVDPEVLAGQMIRLQAQQMAQQYKEPITPTNLMRLAKLYANQAETKGGLPIFIQRLQIAGKTAQSTDGALRLMEEGSI